MSGDIFFLQHHWSGSAGTVAYVMEFLASRVRDPSIANELTELAAVNVAFLDLSDPKSAELVHLIADELPAHVAGLEDPKRREILTDVFQDLYRFAREQQDYNKDPSRKTYFTIGPNPARYFQIENLQRRVRSQLSKVDCVRIDVSQYTPDQRTAIRDYVNELGDPRVSIVGDQ